MKLHFTDTPPVFSLHDTDSAAARLVAQYSFVTPKDIVSVNDAAVLLICLAGLAAFRIDSIGVAKCLGGRGDIYVTRFTDGSCLWMVYGGDGLIGAHTSESIGNPPGRSVTDITMEPCTSKVDPDKVALALEGIGKAYRDKLNEPEAIRIDVAIALMEGDKNLADQIARMGIVN